MTEKAIGYILLTIGLIIIIFSTLSVVNVLTGKTEPIKLFEFTGITFDPTASLSKNLPFDTSKVLKKNNNNIELIPKDMINRTSNIGAHILLMGFLISVGFKISSLGIMLIRPIVVKLKQNPSIQNPT